MGDRKLYGDCTPEIVTGFLDLDPYLASLLKALI